MNNLSDPEIHANVPLYQPRGKLDKDKPHPTHPYGTQFKTQAANTEIITITNSVYFNESVSTGFDLIISRPFEVAKCAQLAVKQLKEAHSYNGTVQQV